MWFPRWGFGGLKFSSESFLIYRAGKIVFSQIKIAAAYVRLGGVGLGIRWLGGLLSKSGFYIGL